MVESITEFHVILLKRKRIQFILEHAWGLADKMSLVVDLLIN